MTDTSLGRRLFRSLPDPLRATVRRHALQLRQLVGGSQALQAAGYDGSLTGADIRYLRLCVSAATNPRRFRGFRRHPDYTSALEHVSEELGRAYLEGLQPESRARKAIAEVAKGDAVGGPLQMLLGDGTRISPTTLRYLKVADDIERLFGDLEGADVIEIGVGYGGQARVIDTLFRVRSYTLVDLHPVLDLAETFLSHFPLRTTVRFVTMNELAPRGYDFALSNYAYTELTRSIQETYFAKALRETKRGYITFNDIVPPHFRSLTRDELCERLQAKVLPEVPLTHPNNCIIAWGAA